MARTQHPQNMGTHYVCRRCSMVKMQRVCSRKQIETVGLLHLSFISFCPSVPSIEAGPTGMVCGTRSGSRTVTASRLGNVVPHACVAYLRIQKCSGRGQSTGSDTDVCTHYRPRTPGVETDIAPTSRCSLHL